jgi:hypothetical protein
MRRSAPRLSVPMRRGPVTVHLMSGSRRDPSANPSTSSGDNLGQRASPSIITLWILVNLPGLMSGRDFFTLHASCFTVFVAGNGRRQPWETKIRWNTGWSTSTAHLGKHQRHHRSPARKPAESRPPARPPRVFCEIVAFKNAATS